jgi:hypothetical protein
MSRRWSVSPTAASISASRSAIAARSSSLCREAGGDALQLRAQLGDGAEVADVDAGDVDPAAGVDLDQPVVGQPAQGVPHRGAAEPQLLDQGALVDHRRRRQLQGHDPVAQQVVGLLAQRVRRGVVGDQHGEVGEGGGDRGSTPDRSPPTVEIYQFCGNG